MDKQTQEAILKWIFDNHQHHEIAAYGDDYCTDPDEPYVNSLNLEKFILSLGVKK